MEGNLTDTLSRAVSRACPLESHPGYRVSAFSSFFFFAAGQYPHTHVDHSSIEGHPGPFQVRALTNLLSVFAQSPSSLRDDGQESSDLLYDPRRLTSQETAKWIFQDGCATFYPPCGT